MLHLLIGSIIDDEVLKLHCIAVGKVLVLLLLLLNTSK